MVHWPKSTVGRVMTIVIALIVGLGLVQSAIALSGTFVWITLAVAVLAGFVAIVVHRRAQEASDLALADAPSFADILPQWNSRRDLEAARQGPTAGTPPSSGTTESAGARNEKDAVERV
jgi:hypothetical protein